MHTSDQHNKKYNKKRLNGMIKILNGKLKIKYVEVFVQQSGRLFFERDLI